MNHELIQKIHKKFLRSGMSLGLAESCTGGLVSSMLTAQSGVSAYYKGSVVSYSADIKVNILGVPDNLIKCMGEVSLPVAKYMAQGARKKLSCDWAVAVTGIAGPSGGTLEKPVGTVCFAVIGPGIEMIERKIIEGKERKEIQLNTAKYALELLNLGIHS